MRDRRVCRVDCRAHRARCDSARGSSSALGDCIVGGWRRDRCDSFRGEGLPPAQPRGALGTARRRCRKRERSVPCSDRSPPHSWRRAPDTKRGCCVPPRARRRRARRLNRAHSPARPSRCDAVHCRRTWRRAVSTRSWDVLPQLHAAPVCVLTHAALHFGSSLLCILCVVSPLGRSLEMCQLY